VDAAGPDVEATTKANAKYQARLLRESSTVISEMAKGEKVKVVGAYYDLSSGSVTLLE
jgi:carbonic anhydrase